ncbi:MAG: hypothetical protein JXO72_11550 [Vicinamibacteria bacterium]|nr:hypothetical protein [Vicinamibacteria bacterium]
MSQYIVIGINAYGADVLARARALPVERNVVYHHLECPPERPVAQNYMAYRRRLLDLLNREVFNFANTPLGVYVVAQLVERHMADNVLHVGYLFKTFFRENIILSPRLTLLTCLPTILPEEAYEWLSETRETLERLDGYAALREPFLPEYPDLKRRLPEISGPPYEDVVFCYSESLDEEDVAVTAQVAATKLYFDLMLRPARAEVRPEIREFYRGSAAGQSFASVSGCALAFLPSLKRLVRDEMEYLLMMRLCEEFFSVHVPDSASVEPLADGIAKKARVFLLRDIVAGVVDDAVNEERWFDLAGANAPSKFDIEISPSAEAHLQTFLASLENDRKRFAPRVRDLALDSVLRLPDRLAALVPAEHPQLRLAETDALFTRAYLRLTRALSDAGPFAREARDGWDRARGAVERKVAQLKEIVTARDAKLKKGSATEARVIEILASVDARELLRLGLTYTVAEALSQDKTLADRLRDAYDKRHELHALFLKRRGEIAARFHNRRDAYLRERELHLYVFNQIFRRRLLDAGIEEKLAAFRRDNPKGSLATLVGAFFFGKWIHDPGLSLETVEGELMHAIRLEAREEIERIAATVRVEYKDVVGVLREIAAAQAASVFDMKYKEHPLAAFREATFLFHADPNVKVDLPQDSRSAMLQDVAVVKELPFEVLQVSEIHNLPFRALRQYASLER